MRRVTGKIGYRGNVWEYDEDDGEKIWEYAVGRSTSCEDKETFRAESRSV
jgi:outer membrane protein assembly factor BamB